MTLALSLALSCTVLRLSRCRKVPRLSAIRVDRDNRLPLGLSFP
jgi:hypothetical protein